MKLLVLPREQSSPYQRLLYTELRRQGAAVSYLGELTPSHLLNLLLLPLELAVRRLGGARLVHLHWVHRFVLPGGGRFPVLRGVAYGWFVLCLAAVRLLGLHLVWTVHNALPHEPVFTDDTRARRRLARSCDLVIVHTPSALAELAAFGAVPRASAVIPHGPLLPPVPSESLRTPGAGDGPRRFLFFGKVREYKGVEDLLAAFAALPGGTAAHLTVAGECWDPDLRPALMALARPLGDRVTLRLERVPDGELTGLLADADVVVLPYRRITTSGSAMLALAHGRPLIVPDLDSLADLPDQAVLRYDRTVPGLTAALLRACGASAGTLAAMSAAGGDFAGAVPWPRIAAMTMSELNAVLGESQPADQRGSALAAR
ncbi:MAG TPA: glycosyltransferase family 4 protein [Streptosporangiaceae bacterium]|nr:glycosyltransferase family 4 protein [Streptosporangiaceae bacterium]